MMEVVNKPIFTISHVVATLGCFATILVYANGTENQVIVTDTQQQAIIKNQDELKADFKAYQVQQQEQMKEQMQLLYEIKGKLRDQ